MQTKLVLKLIYLCNEQKLSIVRKKVLYFKEMNIEWCKEMKIEWC